MIVALAHVILIFKELKTFHINWAVTLYIQVGFPLNNKNFVLVNAMKIAFKFWQICEKYEAKTFLKVEKLINHFGCEAASGKVYKL